MTFFSRTTRFIPPDLSVAGGLVPGWDHAETFGRNTDIDTSEESIWNGGGLYTGFPTGAAETLKVYSTTVADDNGSTGLWTVKLVGLDTNYKPLSEVVTLDGTTSVVTTNAFKRMWRAEGLTAGAGGSNFGVITAKGSTTGANVFMKMPEKSNHTHTCCYTIPAGYTGYITHMGSSIKGTATNALLGDLYTRELGGVWQSRRPFFLTNAVHLDDNFIITIPEKTDIDVRALAITGSNIDVNANIEVFLQTSVALIP